MADQFVNSYKTFVNNSAQIEDSYKELQLNESKLTKHMAELKDDVFKKTKLIDNLNSERDTLNQANNSLEDRIKEIRTEVDKFKKKESLGSNKNQDLEKNQRLNLGKSM